MHFREECREDVNREKGSKSHHGSFMLHGHIHSDGLYNLSNLEVGIKRYDVGVDANGYYPVSINQIENFFKSIMSS